MLLSCKLGTRNYCLSFKIFAHFPTPLHLLHLPMYYHCSIFPTLPVIPTTLLLGTEDYHQMFVVFAPSLVPMINIGILQCLYRGMCNLMKRYRAKNLLHCCLFSFLLNLFLVFVLEPKSDTTTSRCKGCKYTRGLCIRVLPKCKQWACIPDPLPRVWTTACLVNWHKFTATGI